MSERSIKIPGPDHPITIEKSPNHVVVTYASEVIADTHEALLLAEAKYPVVLYISRADANMAKLTASDHHTYCPYKGDCSYYNLPGSAPNAANAIWSYETPYDSVAAIKGHLAFYADRVQITETA